MGYVILIVLLVLTVLGCFFLAAQLIRVADEKQQLEWEKEDLLITNRVLALELSMERSISSETKRDLEDAFSNLEMVLTSEKSPVGSSNEAFGDYQYPNWSNPPGMIRGGITEGDASSTEQGSRSSRFPTIFHN